MGMGCVAGGSPGLLCSGSNGPLGFVLSSWWEGFTPDLASVGMRCMGMRAPLCNAL